MIVHDHVERDVDRVAVIAAQIVEPAGDIATGEGDAGAAGAAERAHQRAGEHGAEVDGKHAEAEQQSVDELFAVLAEVAHVLRAPPCMS